MTQMHSPNEVELLQQEIAIREAALAFKENLPHLYAQKMYRWQHRFYHSTNKLNVLTANNQSGKSAIAIRKAINWATNVELWPKLWKKKPTQFWYLYPDSRTATSEFENKWIVEFLPKEALKTHPIYGWKAFYKAGEISHVRFNSGVTIYFKTYGQSIHSLQAGSCFAIMCDEELPWSYLPELSMRTSAYDGYMHFVFTATKAQDEWRRVVEERGKDEIWSESEVDILKQQISAYDCLYYTDGTPSEVWTIQKIEETKKMLHSENQIQRRIYGKFIKDDGLKYDSFERKRHYLAPLNIDLKKGFIFAGVDYGSGTNHQSAICFVWVSPDYTYGYAFRSWVGDKGISTTAGDVVLKYQELSRDIKVTQVFYDHSAADLRVIAEASGIFFEKAEKGHDIGERIINTLFQNDMLQIFSDEGGAIIAAQLESVSDGVEKKNLWDDGVDALRYAITKIPWVYTNLREKRPEPPTATSSRISRHSYDKPEINKLDIEDEIMEWGDYYETTFD